jgi:hypothetical protein
MVGLVDIAPATERVTIRGQEVEVFGVSAAGVAQLLARFPDLRKLFSGRDIGMEEIMAVGGDLVAAIIAAGTGDPGDPAAEEAAGRLGIDEQADLLSAILRVTLPKGVGPFVEKLLALGAALDASSAVSVPATTSRKQSSG